MTTALTTQSSTGLALREEELLSVLGSSLYPGAAPSSIKMVLGYCKAAGLDPMQKPVHIVPMWDGKTRQMRDVIMPGIGLYRTQAARNGCAGVTEPEFGPDVTEDIGGAKTTYPAWCKVTVKRRLSTGEIVEYTAKEFWRENYAVRGGQDKSIAPNAMWAKRPYGQIAKCAEAQALRKAFPEIGSEPTADEMEGKVLHADEVQVIRHSATQGAVVPDERMSIVVDTAQSIKDHFEQDDVIAAYEDYTSLTDPEEKTAVWRLLPSNIRTAIKKHGASLNEPAGDGAALTT